MKEIKIQNRWSYQILKGTRNRRNKHRPPNDMYANGYTEYRHESEIILD